MKASTAAATAAVLIAGVLVAWWSVARANLEMRADLLQKTRMVERAVNVQRVQALTGTEADLDSLDYRRLKEQLSAVRSSFPPTSRSAGAAAILSSYCRRNC